jgi:hypothetical protein
MQSMPSHYVSLKFILILSIRLHLGFPSGLISSDFPTKFTSASFLNRYLLITLKLNAI